MRILFLTLCCVWLAGCQPAATPKSEVQREPVATNLASGQEPEIAVPKPAARIILELGQRDKERSIALPVEAAELAKRLVAGPPHSESEPQVPLAMRTAVVLDGVRYALQDDEIILLYGHGSKTWKSPGIGKRLIDAARQSANQTSGGDVQ